MPKKQATNASRLSFAFLVKGEIEEGTQEPPGASSLYRLSVEFLNPEGSPIPNEEGPNGRTLGEVHGLRHRGALGQQTLEQIVERFKLSGPIFMLREGLEFLHNIFLHVADGPDEEGDREMIELHLSDTEEFLRAHFEIPVREKRSRNGSLTKVELARLLREVKNQLPRDQHTFPKAAEAIRQREPTRGPASGDALRVLCNRHKLQVKWLRKREGKSKRKAEANNN